MSELLRGPCCLEKDLLPLRPLCSAHLPNAFLSRARAALKTATTSREPRHGPGFPVYWSSTPFPSSQGHGKNDTEKIKVLLGSVVHESQ